MRKTRQFIEQRRAQLLAYIEERGEVTVEELSQQFSAAPSTIRKQLNELHTANQIVRIHGGAKFLPPSQELCIPIHPDLSNASAKEQVARKAREFIQPGDVIAIGCGSTPYFLARLLHGIGRLTIITDSVLVAVELMNEQGVEIRLPSGLVHKRSGVVCSDQPSALLASVLVNKVFIGADGISLLSRSISASPYVVQVERQLLRCGQQSFILADHSKFEKYAVVDRLATFSEVHCVITDPGIFPETVQEARDKGLNLIY